MSQVGKIGNTIKNTMSNTVSNNGGMYILYLIIILIAVAIGVIVFFEQGVDQYRETVMGPGAGIALALSFGYIVSIFAGKEKIILGKSFDMGQFTYVLIILLIFMVFGS